jgi:Uma2 family endonuclease
MSTARRVHYSYREYLSAQEASDIRLEYWAGEIFAMAGGTPEHAALAMQVGAMLSSKLPNGCHAFSSDLKVRISASDVALYADVTVVCGKIERAADDKHAIVNPGLVVEVTSDSTEDYDRGAKLAQYKSIKSLQTVWIISHKSERITVIERQKKSWKTSEFRAGQVVTLASPALSIDVDEVYRVIENL